MSVSTGPKITTSGLTSSLDTVNPNSYSTNTFPSPLDIAAFIGFNANNATMSRDTTISPSPAGGIPFKMAVLGNDPYTSSYAATQWTFATAAAGQTWTVSGYIRASSPTTGGFFIFGANSSGMYIELANPMWNLTTEWQRFSSSITFGDPNTVGIQVRLDGPDSGGTGVNIWFDGLQVEKMSSVTAFNPKYNLNGATIKDVSGNINNGTLLNGTSYVTTNGGALSFDGVDDYVLQSTFGMTSLNPQQITLEAWVKHNNFTGSQAYVNNWHNFSADQRGVLLRTFNGSAYPSFWWCWGTINGSNSYNAVYASSSTMLANTWYHIVGTYEKNVSAKIYINGTLANSTTGGVDKDIVYDTVNKFTVGQSNINGSNMNGLISQARVYNRTLTADEIAQNFEAARGRYGV